MMYIFLDIDGVITTPKQRDSRKKPRFSIMPYDFDEACLDNLDAIIAHCTYDIKIVLSSNWRLYHTKEELNSMLNFYGLPCAIEDMCEDQLIGRASLIQRYIESKLNDDDCVVVIDDIPVDKLFLSGRYGAVFTTNSKTGLTSEVTKEILDYIDIHHKRI